MLIDKTDAFIGLTLIIRSKFKLSTLVTIKDDHEIVLLALVSMLDNPALVQIEVKITSALLLPFIIRFEESKDSLLEF